VCFQNSATAKPFHLQDLIINRDAEMGADQLPTLIDKKVRDNWSLMLLHGVVISSCFVLGI
jgi:hypothetical protein